MKKLALITAILLVLFSACTQSYTQDDEQNEILFIPKSQISSFWEITIDGFYTAIAEYNEIGTVLSTEDEEDIAGQIQIVYDAIEYGYDAIIISALSYEELAEAVQAAIDEGIEVIVIDSDVNVPDIKIRISTDNYNAGYEMGEKMAEMMDYEGNVGVLAIKSFTENLEQRMKGFEDAVRSYENLEIVQIEEAFSTHVEALDGTNRLINSDEGVDAIATFNEITTVAMGEAIEKSGREDLVAIGFDNNTTVVNYLETGVIDGIVVQNQFAMGYLGAQYAIEQHEGKINSSENIDTGVHIVTRENIFEEEIQTILFPIEIYEN